jgi:putative hemolysin
MEPNAMSTASIHNAITVPPVEPPHVKVATYQVRLAQSASDLMRAFKLRYEVFNLELHEGLESSLGSGYDIDRFDPAVDHLVVEHLATGAIVGTYRLHTGISAAQRIGYYSEQEFDFRPYERIRGELVELGRACVHNEHRSGNVLGMLWKAIIDYATERGCRYLVGCSSLTSQDAATGLAAYHALQKYEVEPELRTVPVAAHALPLDTMPAPDVQIPRLLRAYLTIGAKICGPPAIDREFKTIDFLTLIDLEKMSRSARAHLLR